VGTGNRSDKVVYHAPQVPFIGARNDISIATMAAVSIFVILVLAVPELRPARCLLCLLSPAVMHACKRGDGYVR
jgi:hypothetical protein